MVVTGLQRFLQTEGRATVNVEAQSFDNDCNEVETSMLEGAVSQASSVVRTERMNKQS